VTKGELLQAFSAFDEVHQARDATGALSPFERLPASPEPYVEFVRGILRIDHARRF